MVKVHAINLDFTISLCSVSKCTFHSTSSSWQLWSCSQKLFNKKLLNWPNRAARDFRIHLTSHYTIALLTALELAERRIVNPHMVITVCQMSKICIFQWCTLCRVGVCSNTKEIIEALFCLKLQITTVEVLFYICDLIILRTVIVFTFFHLLFWRWAMHM